MQLDSRSRFRVRSRVRLSRGTSGFGSTAARTLVSVSIFTLLAFHSERVFSQSRTRFVPSFSAYGVYDDNLFFSPIDPQGELYTRFSPALALELGVTRAFRVESAYSFDAEAHPDNPGLNRVFARQRATAGLQHELNRLTNWSLDLAYVRTDTPRDLYLDTGLDFGRRPSEGYNGSLALGRRLTSGDALSVGYTVRWADYGTAALRSQALTLGWTHSFNTRTTLYLVAGPNFSADVVAASLSASLEARFRRGGVALVFARGQTPVPTDDRFVISESLGANISFRLSRALDLSFSPGFSRNIGEANRALVYRMNIRAGFRLNRWLSLTGSYSGSYQERGSTNDGANGTEDIVKRNEITFGLTVGRTGS